MANGVPITHLSVTFEVSVEQMKKMEPALKNAREVCYTPGKYYLTGELDLGYFRHIEFTTRTYRGAVGTFGTFKDLSGE